MIEPFANPNLERLTPLRLEGDTVYGHFCGWDTQHTARPGVTPPKGNGYRYFHLCGYEHDGRELDVGKLTLHTVHAGIRLPATEAIKHYENTGSVAAYVRVGDDAHGGWFCGKVRKGLTDEEREELRAATPSGDWRGYNGQRELIGLLAVNTPGFPIEREHATIGGELALVASGLVVNEWSAGERLRLLMARKHLARRLK